MNLAPAVDIARPRTRAECVDGLRPCPWVGCRHHAFELVRGIWQTPFGRIVGDDVPDALERCAVTCTLDEAAEGEHTLEQVGGLWGYTHEWVRQIEVSALARVRDRLGLEYDDHAPEVRAEGAALCASTLPQNAFHVAG